MTREEKQKAIDALKRSAPVMVVTQEEFADYIQTLNKIMDWLEKEPATKNEISYTPEEVCTVLILEGQEHGRGYGLKLSDTIKFTPAEVEQILKAEGSIKNDPGRK